MKKLYDMHARTTTVPNEQQQHARRGHASVREIDVARSIYIIGLVLPLLVTLFGLRRGPAAGAHIMFIMCGQHRRVPRRQGYVDQVAGVPTGLRGPGKSLSVWIDHRVISSVVAWDRPPRDLPGLSLYYHPPGHRVISGSLARARKPPSCGSTTGWSPVHGESECGFKLPYRMRAHIASVCLRPPDIAEAGSYQPKGEPCARVLRVTVNHGLRLR